MGSVVVMAWNKKVLDSLEQLYWSPKKLGLQSVRCTAASDTPGFAIPEGMSLNSPWVYTRRTSFAEWRAGICRDEELLNQVIEIALGIAPSSFIAQAFFAPLGIETEGQIEVVGREVLSRHAALAPQQYTQHDGFYVARDAIVGMEMKLEASTQIEQFLKYCTQIALEEITNGRKPQVGLLYLVPAASVARTRRDLSLDAPEVHARIWDDPLSFTDKSRLKNLLKRHGAEIRSVGNRIKVSIITWDDFMRTLLITRASARAEKKETLEKLMDGLIDQIRATPGCGLSNIPPDD